MQQYSPRERYWLIVTIMLAICAVLGVACDSLPRFQGSDYLWFRFAGLGALVAGGFWLFCAGYKPFEARAVTSWWDPSLEPDGELEWDMVLNLTLGRLDLDPLSVNPAERPARIKRDVLILALATLLLGYVALGIAHVLGDQRSSVPSATEAAAGGGNLAAFLALFAAMLSIVFTYHQLRAKVRADNRQAWIARLRTLIAEVTALSYECHDADNSSKPELWQKLGPKRLEFELMLNPSEKDHRLLMYLVQRLAPADEEIQDFIQDAKNLRRTVMRYCKPMHRKRWACLLECDNREMLVGYVMRLSHVVLKREWERVKRAR